MPVDVMMIGLRSVGGGQGGVERHVDKLSEELDNLGLSVDILVRRPYQRESGRRGKATRIISLWSPKVVWMETIAHSLIGLGYAAIKRPAILHVHAIGPSIISPLARLCGLRVVTTHHGEDYNREKWGPFGRQALRVGEWCQARFANRRICVSRSLAVSASARLKAHFEYVPNGVDLPGTVVGSGTLARFGLVPGAYLLNVSRLVPEKRQLDLIAAFAKLQHPGLKLALVGAADHEGAYSEAVRTAAADVPGVLMTGFQTGAALAELYANAAVFLLPSTHEGLPIALLEALSYGRPVVVSDIQANLDLGLPPDCYHRVLDTDDLVTRIKARLSQNPDSGVPAVDWTTRLAEFDWRAVAAATAQIYRGAARLNENAAVPETSPR
jgi:glycosyltransferase involved in cell wall biosynthesis